MFSQSELGAPAASGLLPSRVLRLPAEGRLLICTDIHGNLRDFSRMVELFRRAEQAGERPILLFSGDLIHGPNAEEHEWPSYLGTFYRDQSGEVMEAFIALQQQFPGRVVSLLGNHEHSHVGGPHTPKFWTDETAHFERHVGPERSARYREVFRSFPLVAIAPCGAVVCHAAPNVRIDSAADLEGSYEGFELLDINSMYHGAPICRLLWCRHCPGAVARGFLDALSTEEHPMDLVVFGHDIVVEGFHIVGAEQLQLSTSFGVDDDRKYYLELDLSRRYRGTEALAVGREIKRLHPGTVEEEQS